ncbi:MAG: peptide chain release factor 1 [Acholeplasmatales bacterium]|jgi:peptide chain release factor 1|nr:peptide chain release factor 1 [Acholeplasmatales bacterium]
MFEYLDLLEKNYIEKQEQLNSGINDNKKMIELSKEIKKMEKIVSRYREYQRKIKALADLKELIKSEHDLDILTLAESEKEEVSQEILNLEDELKILLLPKDPMDEKNVVVEIKGAVGGDEADLFAGDLFRMYSKYCDAKGWKISVLTATAGSMGGYSNLSFMISGEAIYSLLKYESGVHRVQRVPETESLGRVHTSTASVLVLPEADEIDFDLDWKDIRIDTMTSSGPGGQSVNTTQSAVRLTYLPTGLQVASQVAKSQYENKDLAYKLLKTRLFDEQVAKKEAEDSQIRHKFIKRSERAEKIRTYNFPQNRLTDHRINFTIQSLNYVMEGKLDLVIDALIADHQKKLLAGGLSDS